MAMQKTVKLNVSTGTDLWPYQVIDEIQKVMEQGARDGKTGWEGEYSSTHIHKAEDHLTKYFHDNSGEEDNLTHAFTRIMMAVAIERGYVKAADERAVDDEFARRDREKEEFIRTGKRTIRPERKEAMKRAGTWRGDKNA